MIARGFRETVAAISIGCGIGCFVAPFLKAPPMDPETMALWLVSVAALTLGFGLLKPKE